MLNLTCTDCGKPCRSQTECDIHTKRTGHSNFEDKVDGLLQSPPSPWDSPLWPIPVALSIPISQTGDAKMIDTEQQMKEVRDTEMGEAGAEKEVEMVGASIVRGTTRVE